MKKSIRQVISLALILAMVIPSGGNIKANNSMKVISSNQMSSKVQGFEINAYNQSESKINFDSKWKFYLGDSPDAKNLTFQDASWENINLPHDYSLTQNYSQNAEQESGNKPGGIGWYRKVFTLGEEFKDKKVYLHFDGAYMDAEVYVNGTQVAFHPYGYTAFKVDITDHIFLDKSNLVAVKTNNPVPSSRWYSGSGLYRSVYLEKSDKLHFESYGVKVTTPDLSESNKTNVKVKVEAQIKNEKEDASNIKVKARLLSGGNLVGESEFSDVFSLQNGQTITKELSFNVQNPTLWDIENPHLHNIEVSLYENEKVVDKYEKEYGIRFFKFLRDEGFKLNGRHLKLKGVSMHHDQGALGSRAYYDAIERQVLKLKSMGVNSIRVTHNPSARHLKDAANRHGILLIEEAFDTWELKKNQNNGDYARWFNVSVQPFNMVGANSSQTWAEFDIKQMVKEGLNDASIIMWSTGNEIHEGVPYTPQNYYKVVKNLYKWIDEIDGERYVTFGDNKLKKELDYRARNEYNASKKVADELAQKPGKLKGIVGYNYADGRQYDTGYNNHPDWIIYGSETASSINSRGIYKINSSDNNYEGTNKLLTSYDTRSVGWGHTAKQAWFDVVTRDYVAGEYVWTGFDYLGEPTPWNNIGRGAYGGWPAPKSSYFGIIETTGFPKDSYYFYQSQWNDHLNTLHILPQWNRDEIKIDWQGMVKVVVYSDAPKVELFRLTPEGEKGESLGVKEFTKEQTGVGHTYQYHGFKAWQNLELVWNVEYKDGGLMAVAYNESGEEIKDTVGNKVVRNYGEAKKLKATANKSAIEAKAQSLVYVEVDVLDNDDIFVANASNNISFEVTGPGKLVGVDNGHQADHQSYQDDNRNALSGKVLAIVESTGESGTITISAKSAGLQTATVSVNATGSSSEDGDKIKKIIYSPIIYIKKGTELSVPNTVQIEKFNGEKQDLSVKWELPTDLKDKLSLAGTFSIIGKIYEVDSPITITIVVLDDIAALLNYSTATVKGERVTLPATRRAISPNGELLDISFPVEWDEIPDSKFEQNESFMVNGIANVFGKEIQVKALVRMAEATKRYGTNVAPLASTISEDIEESLRTDNLGAVKDGNRRFTPNYQSGPNRYVWSNFKAAQEGIDNATLSFVYDTAQNIGKVDIYFFTDTYSARLPQKVEFSYNTGTGEDKLIGAREFSRSNPSGNVTKISYELDNPVAAVTMKLKVTNSPEQFQKPDKIVKAVTGITEVEFITVTQSLEKGSSAELEALKINGKFIPTTSFIDNEYGIEAIVADIEAVGRENAVITEIPAYNNKIKLFVESEDQSKLEIYTINLDTKEPTPPSDPIRDIDREKVKFTAGSEQNYQHRVENVNDGFTSSIWHTAWRPLASSDKLYAVIESLEDGAKIEAIRYLPRQGSGDGDGNGRVQEYEVYYSNDNLSWKKLTDGIWKNTEDWKVAEFEPIAAKYFKLVGNRTYGNPPNKYMSASEIRLRKVKEKIDLSTAEVTLENDIFEYNKKEINPTTKVVLNGNTLRYGIDYKHVLENNINPTENATLKIVGIDSYGGEVVKNFKILDRKIELRDTEENKFEFNRTNLTDKLYIKVENVLLSDSSLLGFGDIISELGSNEIYFVKGFNPENNMEISQQNSINAKFILSDEMRNLDNVKIHFIEGGNISEVDVTLNSDKTELEFTMSKFGKYVVSAVIDKTLLEETLENSKSKLDERDLYKESSILELESAISEAEKVFDNKMAKKSEVESARAKLQNKINTLILNIENDNNLKKLLELAKKLDLDTLKPSSGKFIYESMVESEKYLLSGDLKNETTAKLYTKLKEAIENRKIKADLVDIKKVVNDFRSLNKKNYTINTYNAVDELVAKYENIDDKLELDQIEVDSLKDNILEAVKQLKPRANISVLKENYEKMLKEGLGKYYNNTIGNMKKILKKIQEKLQDEKNIDVETFDSLNKEFASAKSELILKPVFEKMERNVNIDSSLTVVGTFNPNDLDLEIVKWEDSTDAQKEEMKSKISSKLVEELNKLTSDHLLKFNRILNNLIEKNIDDKKLEVYEATAKGEMDKENVKFALKVPVNINKGVLSSIVHISSEKGVEIFENLNISNGYAKIEVMSLSPFVMVYKEKENKIVIPSVPKENWQKKDNDNYYIKEDETLVKGWFQENGKWYYFDEVTGKMRTGWIKWNEKWYFLNYKGEMKTGWIEWNNNWYYLNKYGDMRTGWVKTYNKWYFLGSNGAMKTGWIKWNEKWYHLNYYGEMRTGWLEWKNHWYYLDTGNGSMVVGQQKINNVVYRFNLKNGNLE